MQNRHALTQQRFYLCVEKLEFLIMNYPALMGASVISAVLASVFVLGGIGAPVVIVLLVPLVLLIGGTIGIASLVEHFATNLYDANLHANLRQEQRRARLRRRHPELANTPDSLIDNLYPMR